MMKYAALFLVLVAASSAEAAPVWVDRPLTLPPLKFAADAGLGVARYANPLLLTENKVGAGSNLEAAVGLPFLGEIGVRIGPRFGDDGRFALADRFGRLFDTETYNSGLGTIGHPEIRMKGTLLPLKVFELGTELRVTIPTSDGSRLGTMFGVPMRIHIPGAMRIDTGVHVPVIYSDPAAWAVTIPAQLWIQVGDAFFGPISGVRFFREPDERFDILGGIGGGYTVAGLLDLKAQILMTRINDASPFDTFGFGIGAGIYVP
jgi:hypothetical protein